MNPSVDPDIQRVRNTIKREMYKQALDLAKSFARNKSSEEMALCLRDAYIAAIQNHIRAGKTREANLLLSEAESIPYDNKTWWQQLAELRMKAGQLTKAIALMEKAGMHDRLAALTIEAADLAALGALDPSQASGTPEILPDWQAQFKTLGEAFAQYEAGADEKVKELLQGISMSSPFLPWKLMLRGLIALAAGEKPLALENFNRIDRLRLPYELLQPVLKTMGAAVEQGKNQTPKDFALLPKRAATMNIGVDQIVQQVNQLQAKGQMEDPINSARYFNLYQLIQIDVKKYAPELLPRLVALAYRTLKLEYSEDHDFRLFKNSFGTYPDDPDLELAHAFQERANRNKEDALKFLNKYLTKLDKIAALFPGQQLPCAKAMIWQAISEEQDEPEIDFEDNPFFSIISSMGGFKMNPAKMMAERAANKKKAVESLKKSYQIYPTDNVGMRLVREILLGGQDDETLVEPPPPSKADYQLINDIRDRYRSNASILTEIFIGLSVHEQIDAARETLMIAIKENPFDSTWAQRLETFDFDMALHQMLAGEYEQAAVSLQRIDRTKLSMTALIAAAFDEVKPLLLNAPKKAGRRKKGDPEPAPTSGLIPRESLGLVAGLWMCLTFCKAPKALLGPVQQQYDDFIQAENKPDKLHGIARTFSLIRRTFPKLLSFNKGYNKITARLMEITLGNPSETIPGLLRMVELGDATLLRKAIKALPPAALTQMKSLYFALELKAIKYLNREYPNRLIEEFHYLLRDATRNPMGEGKEVQQWIEAKKGREAAFKAQMEAFADNPFRF